MVAALCVQSEKGTGLGGVGDALVVVPAPAVAEHWAVAPASEILSSALPAVERVLPGLRDRVREARVIRLEDGVFVPAPGHFEAVRAWDGADLPANVALAGEYLVAPTVEGAVRSGLAAGRRLSSAGA